MDYEEEKGVIRNILIDCAKRNGFISYSDLVTKIKAIMPTDLHARDNRLFNLLGEISREEHKTDPPRPMLSAVVIGKNDNLPGRGFFTLAGELGKYHGTNEVDRQHFWNEEVARVHDWWHAQN